MYFCCFISLIVLCMLLLNVCMIVLIYFLFCYKNLHCCLIHTCTKLVLHTFVCPPSDYPCQVDPLLKRLQDWSSRSTRERNSESSSTEVKKQKLMSLLLDYSLLMFLQFQVPPGRRSYTFWKELKQGQQHSPQGPTRTFLQLMGTHQLPYCRNIVADCSIMISKSCTCS